MVGNAGVWIRYGCGVWAARHRQLLPARPAVFLDWCESVGIMRRSGSVVQFRHRLLQQYLASIPLPDMVAAMDRIAQSITWNAQRSAWYADRATRAGQHDRAQELYERAQELYERALAADPTRAQTLSSYAIFMKRVRREYDRAQDLYERALAADPTDANTLGNYARLLFILGRDEKGEDRALAALQHAGDDPDIELQLRAECRFYLFAHVPAKRAESGGELQELLARGVSTGDWNFDANVERVRAAGDDRALLLAAVAAALKAGDPTGLDQFDEWQALSPAT